MSKRFEDLLQRVTRAGLGRWLNALYPPNLIYILRNVNTDRLCYERKFLAGQMLGRREWGVIFPHGMGDLYLTCAFAEAVLEQRGGEGFAVFVKPHLAYIPTLFKGISRVVPVHDFNLGRIQQNYHFEQGRLFSVFPLHNFLNVIGYKGIHVLDYYCLFLELALGTVPAKPRLQTRAEQEAGLACLQAHGLRAGHTVLLAPQAASSPVIENAFWERLAAALKAQGLDVALNDPWRRSASVAGAVSMDIPLENFIGVCEAAGAVVSMRSGLCDLLANANCRLTVLYREDVTQAQRQLARGFSLVGSDLRPDTTEIWYRQERANDALERVVAALKG